MFETWIYINIYLWWISNLTNIYRMLPHFLSKIKSFRNLSHNCQVEFIWVRTDTDEQSANVETIYVLNSFKVIVCVYLIFIPTNLLKAFVYFLFGCSFPQFLFRFCCFRWSGLFRILSHLQVSRLVNNTKHKTNLTLQVKIITGVLNLLPYWTDEDGGSEIQAKMTSIPVQLTVVFFISCLSRKLLLNWHFLLFTQLMDE